MARRVNIPWVRGRNTMGRRVYIPWVGGRYTMSKGSKYHRKGVDMPCDIESPTNSIKTHPTHGISTPYPWYIDPLPMVYRPPYSWYINPLSMVYRPLSIVYRSPYSRYFEPPIHGTFTSLSMDIKSQTHDISTTLPMVF
jgi:hypothetical protein